MGEVSGSTLDTSERINVRSWQRFSRSFLVVHSPVDQWCISININGIYGYQPSLLCMCTEAELSIFSQESTMNRRKLRKQMPGSMLMRSWTLNGIIVLDTLQEQPATTLSMLRLNNPVLYSVQRLNTPKVWKWGWGGEITHNVAQKDAESFLLSSRAWNTERGRNGWAGG